MLSLRPAGHHFFLDRVMYPRWELFTRRELDTLEVSLRPPLRARLSAGYVNIFEVQGKHMDHLDQILHDNRDCVSLGEEGGFNEDELWARALQAYAIHRSGTPILSPDWNCFIGSGCAVLLRPMLGTRFWDISSDLQDTEISPGSKLFVPFRP